MRRTRGGAASELVVLGSCGAWPEAGRACSGFLLVHEGTRVVLDLGYGTLSRLLHELGSSAGDGVDAVVVTHEHADHMVDLHGLLRARWYGRRGAERIPLLAPPGVLRQLRGLEVDDATAIEQVFAWRSLPAPGQVVGPFLLESWQVPHFVPAVGVRLSAPGLTVAYTGDTGPSPVLADLGRDADLYIVESSDRSQVEATTPVLHLDAVEAGRAAAAAGARRLLLTHFWPGIDRDRARRAAARAYEGELLVATEGLRVPLP